MGEGRRIRLGPKGIRTGGVRGLQITADWPPGYTTYCRLTNLAPLEATSKGHPSGGLPPSPDGVTVSKTSGGRK